MNQKSLHNLTTSPKALPLCALIFLAIFSLAVGIIISSNRFDPASFYNAVIEQIYVAHYNNFNVFHVGTIDGKTVVSVFEIIALCSTVLTVFIFSFFLNFLMPQLRLNPLRAMTVCWLVAFVIFSFLVQVKRASALKDYHQQFSALKPEDRIKAIMGMPYVFATHCGQRIKKPMVTKYFTDTPPTKDPYMTWQRGLSYYFYPKVSVRIPREGEVIGHLYFYKKDVQAHIPKDHRIACQSNDLNYVLTVQNSQYDEYIDH